MKISVFILLGFMVILSMFSITTYINFQLAEQVNENSQWLERSTIIVRNSNRFQRNILNMVSGLRGYLFTGEMYFIQAFDSASVENDEILQELKQFIPASSIQRTSLQQIDDMNAQWLNNFAKPLIEAKRTSAISDSALTAFNLLYRQKLQSGEERSINNRLNTRLRNFINLEYSIRENRKIVLEKSILKTRRISIYLTTFSLVTGLFIAIFLAHRISKRIIKMVSMANTIASGKYDVYMEDTGQDELTKLATSLNHMAKMLSENISLLTRKNKELDQFAHIVSHDMKAPLRGIDNVVTWIEEDHLEELSPKVREYVGLIKSRIVRGENLINGILSYSRVGQYELEQEEVNVSQLIGEIQENLPLKRGMKIKLHAGLPVFWTQRVPLMQIFTNLIQNAIKYNDKLKGEISIYHEETEDRYIFSVKDNGPGISKNYHDKIFVIFQTLNGNDSFESTGVGLAIVKKILDDRNQEIRILSEPGKGSVFTFTWPKFNINGKPRN